jgi:putative transposase
MPATKTKRIKKLVDEFSAPKVIEHQIGVLKKTKQGRTKYKSGATNFNLVIVKDDVGIKRTFATNLGVEEKDVFNLFKLYSKRWGIETSYRVKGEFKPKTTSKNYVVRLFYFLFSVCLYNLWVLASIFLGAIIGRFNLKKPLITAKFFGTLLYTFWDDGG